MSIPEHEFRFLEHVPMVDGDLELVPPAAELIDAMLATLGHPLTRAQVPEVASLTREALTRFVEEFPRGHQPAGPGTAIVPAYHFWMRVRPGRGVGLGGGLTMAGGIGFRVGQTENLERHIGHIGYNVYPPAQGRGYARRAVRLLLPLAKWHGINPLWITCDPANAASRRTCEGAGGRLVDVVKLPEEHALYAKGEREKCRYRFDL
jgi:predicted acetyltransferase